MKIILEQVEDTKTKVVLETDGELTHMCTLNNTNEDIELEPAALELRKTAVLELSHILSLAGLQLSRAITQRAKEQRNAPAVSLFDLIFGTEKAQ